MGLSRYPGYFSLVLSGICLLPQMYLHFNIIRYTILKCAIKSMIIFQLATLFNTCYILWVFWLSIYSVILINNPSYKFDVNDCFHYFFMGTFLLFSKVSIYLFYIMRSYEIFVGSMYEWNKKLIIIICIFVVIIFSSVCGPTLYLCVSVAISLSKSNANNDDILSFSDCAILLGNNRKWMIYLTIIGLTITEIISSIIVLRLYLSKLMLLSLAANEMNIAKEMELDTKTKTNDNSKQNNNNNHSVNTSNITNKDVSSAPIFQLAMRITNTIILTITSTAFIILLSGATQYWMVVGCLLNTLSMYLSFKFGEKLYKIVCYCDKIGYKICIKLFYSCCSPKSNIKTKIIRLQSNTITNHNKQSTCTDSKHHSNISENKV